MKRLLRITVGLIVGLALATVAVELLLRAFPSAMPEMARLRMHWDELKEGNELRSNAHAELGFVFVPETTGSYELTDLSFEYDVDGHGFRNAWPWPERAEIVVVGDSLAFGFGVEDAATWSRLVDDALVASVVNLSLPGYCPEQYRRTYELLGAGLAPQLVILGLFPTNDVKDQAKFRAWLADGAPGNYDEWRFRGGSPSFLKSTHLYNFVVETLKQSHTGFRSSTLELDDGPLRLTPAQINSAAKHVKRGGQDFDDAVRSIARVRKQVRTAGARLLIVLFPCKEEVYLPLLGGDTPEPVKPFVEEFRERGWEHLDLTPILAAGAERGERLYFEIDGHPNARGNRLTADAILAWIAEHAPELQ